MLAEKQKSIDSGKKLSDAGFADAEERIEDIKAKLYGRMVDFFADDAHDAALKNFFVAAEKILLSGNAKRLRCIIPVLISDHCNMSENECMNYGVVVEMLHYTSLTHDDVIDQDMYRRGCETLNNNFSNAQAVLLGDYILCMAIQKCQKFIHDQKVTGLVIQMVQQLITGVIIEQRELGDDTSLDDYRKMAELKTGSLFALSFALPFINETEETLNQALSCGKNFGTMFQIFDDYMDREDDDPGINSFSLFSLEEVIVLWNKATEVFIESAKALGIEDPVVILMNHLRKLGYFGEVETEAGLLFEIPFLQ